MATFFMTAFRCSLVLIVAVCSVPLAAQTAPDPELASALAHCAAQINMQAEQRKAEGEQIVAQLNALAQQYLFASAALSSDEVAKQVNGDASYREIVHVRMSTRSGDMPQYLKFLNERVRNCQVLFEKNETYLKSRQALKTRG